jgi:cell division protein FtsB
MHVGRILLAATLLVMSAALLVHTLLSPDGWNRRQKARADLEVLRAENNRLEHEVQDLRGQIEALRTREEVQERVIRDELGYVRPGDVNLEVGTKP